MVVDNISDNRPKKNCPKIDIIDKFGDKLAVARLLDLGDLEDEYLISLFVKARSRHSDMFLTKFQPSTSQTMAWMRKLICSDDRLMFVIEYNETIVGHYGLIILDDQTIEMDNAILWDRRVPKGFMIDLEHAMLRFAFGSLQKNTAIARVLSHNLACINLHRRTGFKFQSEEALIVQTSENGRMNLKVGSEKDGRAYGRRLLSLSLQASEYWSIFV